MRSAGGGGGLVELLCLFREVTKNALPRTLFIPLKYPHHPTGIDGINIKCLKMFSFLLPIFIDLKFFRDEYINMYRSLTSNIITGLQK